MEIAVLGDDEFMTGFMLAGVRHYFEPGQDIHKTMETIMQNKEIGIVIMDEKDYNTINPKLKEVLENKVQPVVVPLSKEGRGEDLRKYIKRTLGVDLWQKEKSTG
ncbi:MAG: V-type ATP synthase subunit F [Candidatus Aenigmarchaeota archaeon]|nr:V-type ATP synthase subunit F [Candidatus Aenigmarchaeota archaeon]